jgi:N-acetylglucosaminyldiphosphoundecaprenol N-acetyl-beta-D-mannosaminyltransferase
MSNQVTFLGTSLTIVDKDEALSRIQAASLQEPISIATVNPEFLLTAQKFPPFRDALQKMSFCIIDGSGFLFGLRIASLFARVPRHRYSLYHGSDLVADLLQKYSQGGKSFYIVGGPPGQARRAADKIRGLHPSINIVGAEDGGIIDEKDIYIDPALCQRISQARPDILFVGFGAPKQELWMNKAGSIAPVMIGVGGTFGFYTDKKRAPKPWRSIHLEWLYRSIVEHGHWRRALRASVYFPLRSLIWIISGR